MLYILIRFLPKSISLIFLDLDKFLIVANVLNSFLAKVNDVSNPMPLEAPVIKATLFIHVGISIVDN